jgi:ribosomal protein L11 methyltransferase
VELAALGHYESFEAALAPVAGATSVQFDERRGTGSMSAFFDTEPDRAELEARLAVAAAAAETAPPPYTLASVPDADWVKRSEAGLPAIVAGRFEIRGSHVQEPTKAGRIPIRLDAGMAFGTGRHESTRGCLIALDRLARRLRPRRMLDLGCGSGILAIAMARLWKGIVVAADIDPVAVEVGAANAAANGVANRIAFVVSRGFANRRLRQSGPYDLVAANILAEPLVRMASTLSGQLVPGGMAILSGLLDGEKAAILAAYARLSVMPTDEVRVDGWATLVLRRRPGHRTPVRAAHGSE